MSWEGQKSKPDVSWTSPWHPGYVSLDVQLTKKVSTNDVNMTSDSDVFGRQRDVQVTSLDVSLDVHMTKKVSTKWRHMTSDSDVILTKNWRPMTSNGRHVVSWVWSLTLAMIYFHENNLCFRYSPPGDISMDAIIKIISSVVPELSVFGYSELYFK